MTKVSGSVRVALGVGMLGALVLSGCVSWGGDEPWYRNGPVFGGEVWLLNVTVTVLAPWNETEQGAPQPETKGGHCGDVFWDQGMSLEKSAIERVGTDRPLVLFDPDYVRGDDLAADAMWYGFGDQPVLVPWPIESGAGAYYHERAYHETQPLVVSLAYEEGEAMLFGEPFVMPHRWIVQDPQGSWRADATLSMGPEQHYRWQSGSCE